MPPRHPFTPAALQKKSTPLQPVELPSCLPDDVLQRKKDKKKVDIDSQSLIVSNQARGKKYHNDLTPLAEKYPNSLGVLRQLLLGAELHVAKRIVSYQTHQDSYLSIIEFIEFLNSDEPINKRVASIGDIDGQTCLHFRAYLIRLHPGRTTNRKRYGAMRSIVGKLKKVYKGEAWVGAIFKWPRGPEHNETPTESYTSDVHNSLIDSCLQEISLLMKWMTQGQAVGNSIEGEELSLENVMYEIASIKSTSAKYTRNRDEDLFESRIKGYKFVSEYLSCSGLTIEEFLCLYRERGTELAALGRPIRGVRVTKGGIDESITTSDVIRTAKELLPDWPFFMPFEESINCLSTKWAAQFRSTIRAAPVEKKLLRLVQAMRLNIDGSEVEEGQMAYISTFAFTMSTIFPFALLLLIQTGWNLETLLSIGLDLHSHVEEDLLDSDYVIVYGIKGRTEKTQIHRSNKRDKFGAYQLLCFVESVMSKHAGSPHIKSINLFQFVLSKNLWGKYFEIVRELRSATFNYASKGFLARHGIITDPEAKDQVVEIRRLRTTYETRRKEQGLDIDQLASDMGHSDIDTTIWHYDSDQGSSDLFNRRLRGIQEKHVDDLRFYSARLVTDASLVELRKATEFPMPMKSDGSLRKLTAQLAVEESQVVHLISPSGQTYIASCLDSKMPDWPGARAFVPEGRSCNYFNRCPLCSKCVVFKEALPYIARRVCDLESLKSAVNTLEWENNFGDEFLALNKILDDWGDKSAVAHAYTLQSENTYALPITMIGPTE